MVEPNLCQQRDSVGSVPERLAQLLRIAGAASRITLDEGPAYSLSPVCSSTRE
jgi:hypothetical protein